MTEAVSRLWHSQPHAIVERDGVRYTLLGTAHVSRASVDAVEDAIDSGGFDTVAVELDAGRLQALTDPDTLASLNLVDVIRKGRVAMFAANLALAAYQRRLAEQLGIEPGAELKRAVAVARERGLAVELIDREVGLTFRRASSRLGFFGKLKLASSLLAGLMSSEEMGEDEIEKLKQGDMLESSFGEFAQTSPALYESVIAERDRYMAARLREVPDGAREVLAVVGAGHLAGLARHLAEDADRPGDLRAQLEYVPPKRSMRWITTAVMVLILAMIGWGFWHGGAELGRQMVTDWVVITAGFAALGAIAAAAHPLGVLAAAIAAPLKPFRPPGVSPGLFSALIEARLRKPAYGDFLALRDDAVTLRGWYRNRVSRTILNFILTNVGSSIGVWVAGLRIARQMFS
ncbi:TraB/GumN family protein [Luteimonas sp. MHLX1A]|uniref:TraB/GumN family protein n=1 Tax=Alterluteimonas muca TaxID=2878684 RepID=UPI001E64E035|nr:TraB/GumN family protein [Luteimonas sp. MHLX1A]MCD9045660.1 TraB/GumN family protein [Luteimonas sp. MHLX1A]